MPKSSPVAQIWILAALSLPYRERVEAMQDIADMLGTRYGLVASQASVLAARRHAEATEAGQTVRKPPFSKTAYVPSKLRPLTKAQLMSGKAR